MSPIRVDILDESVKHFVMNMLYGMWVNNEWVGVELTCGACGVKNETSCRDKDKEVKCPCCGVMNVIDLG